MKNRAAVLRTGQGWLARGLGPVRAQAGVTPGGLLGLGGLEQLVVGGQAGAAGGGVPEVIADRPAADIQAAGAGVHQADGQFGILAAPAGEGFVVAVDLEEVVAPDGQVTAAYAAQVGTVAAGILPAVEPGVSPGGMDVRPGIRLEASSAGPGGKMPAATCPDAAL